MKSQPSECKSVAPPLSYTPLYFAKFLSIHDYLRVATLNKDMIIDIITGVKFTKDEFINLIGRHACRELEIEKSKQWKSRYILDKNWESLIIELIDSVGNIYNCVRPSSMNLYIGDLSSDDRNGRS